MTPNHSEVTHALVHSFLLQNEVSLAGPIEPQKNVAVYVLNAFFVSNLF